MAQRERNEFDYLVLEYINYFYELGENALEKIHNSKYYDVVKKARKKDCFAIMIILIVI